jgi:hypothetical protein
MSSVPMLCIMIVSLFIVIKTYLKLNDCLTLIMAMSTAVVIRLLPLTVSIIIDCIRFSPGI